MTKRKWPATIEEYRRLEAIAKTKYAPLVARLHPYELSGLAGAVEDGMKALRVEIASGSATCR